MRRNGNKVLIIVLSVLGVLAVVVGIFIYLFLATDVFKSNQQLFAKYLTQNMNAIETIGEFSALEQLDEQLQQNKYEENITITCSEPEEEKIIGQLTIDTQNDPINKKNYGIVGLLVDGLEKTLEVEYMRDNDMYSLRFTNSVKQFLSIENNNLKQFARNLGMDEVSISQIPDKIDFENYSQEETILTEILELIEKLKLTEEEKKTEINKYLNLAYNYITKEKYTKTKNAVITVNGNTITTDAYVLTLNMEDLKNIFILLLENIKQDEIILSRFPIIEEKLKAYTEYESEEESLKDIFVEGIQALIDAFKEEEVPEDTITITVYKQGKNTVRIKLEQGLSNITLDTTLVDGKQQIDLRFTNIDEDNTQESYGITLIKENSNKLTIKFISIIDEEQNEAVITMEVVQKENNVRLNISTENEYFQISFTREVTILDEINYAVTLDNSNNIVLNEMSAEKIENILKAVSERIVKDYVEPAELILAPIMLVMNASQALENVDLTETEKAAFNMKFQNYESSQASVADVRSLLGVVLRSNDEIQEDELFSRYINVTGDITLEDYNLPSSQFKSKYYSIQCKKDIDGWVNEIVILEQKADVNLEQTSNSDVNNVSIQRTASIQGEITPGTIMQQEEMISNTGNKIVSLLRTIGTIAIVFMILF